MALPPQQPVSSATADRPVRVLVIADPGFIGERVCAIVAANPALELAGQVTDGISAVSFLRRSAADGVVIDIGHPEAQVKVTLSRMFRLDPDIKVVMVGSLNFANVKTSMMGLMEGAAEFVPAASRHTGRTDRQFADELAEVLKAFGRREREIIPPAPPARGRLDAPDAPAPKTVYTSKATPALSLRPPSRRIPEILAIGSSTGGPHALFTVLAMLATNVRLPILITQHMPSKFTTILAQHIDRHTGIPCSEGQHGDKLAAGRVYVAPSDHHMTVAMSSTGPEIRLDQSPKRNFCRPSVDPMLESLAKIYGPGLLTVILTGMGKDGLVGGKAVVEAGGTVIAQDAETSVVWGMPGAVAMAGICSAVLPLDEIAPYVSRAFRSDW
jgi:two-component system chemotaxis response regulator CheB